MTNLIQNYYIHIQDNYIQVNVIITSQSITFDRLCNYVYL